MKRAIVTGAGGFIGWHLCNYLKEQGYWVRGVDKKWPEFARTDCEDYLLADLRDPVEARDAFRGCESFEVYHLAADMGGIGYIATHLADCALNNSMIDNAVISAVLHHGCKVFVYTSSACVYRQDVQSEDYQRRLPGPGDHIDDPIVAPRLTEGKDDWPADPEPGYGLQKLYTEKLLEYLADDRNLDVRIARPHNVYGPFGTYEGGREKAPAALCRKFALAGHPDETVDVWGDGSARRSFLYIDDFVRGLHLLATKHFDSAPDGPVNIGHEQDVSIRELAEMIQDIANNDSPLVFVPDGGPQGVRVRSCNAEKAKKFLGWEPEVDLEEGLRRTYEWIAKEVADAGS